MPLVRRSSRSAAFTLVELLVVITIIGILAGIALPVYNGVTERANQTKALAQAKQIGLALKLYAGDHDGAFPNKVQNADGTLGDADITTANQAFRQLFPTYINQEKIFYVGKSKFTPKAPDENTATAADILKAGENHFAYVMNLSDTSNAAFPLVADGFATVGTDPAWTDQEDQKGGVWKGKKAVILRVDQSAEIVTLGTNGAMKFKATRPGDATKNLFSPDPAAANPWLGTTQKPLNPE